jgi:tetratricopeptide (TPR) repeat protein
MELADNRVPNADKLLGESKLPVAVLANPEGAVVSKLENTGGKLKVEQVEKLVESEVKQRESGLDSKLKEAKEKVKAGDKESAIKLFQAVVSEKCMFKKKANDAAKELKKLGAPEVAFIPDSPVFEPRRSALIERTMVRGLMAEIKERYQLAERYYTQARALDPADPTPLRYLGELYRHHIGDWDKARHF